MKDFCQYGNRRDDEWEILPWIPDPRPPFKIWVKPEQIAPFFLIPHHPYAISLLLKISDGFRTEKFRRLGLTGSSADWERLVRGVIQEFEENNSGVDLFHFDSDEDVFCVYSQYIDDLMMLAKMIRAACADEKTMGAYLGRSEYIKQMCIRDRGWRLWTSSCWRRNGTSSATIPTTPYGEKARRHSLPPMAVTRA